MKEIKDVNLPLETIERGLRDGDRDVRVAAMNACQGRDVPLETIERGLRDGDCDVRAAAMNACQGRDVPLETIERGLIDGDWRVRVAAMNACQGRDVRLETIERGLRDGDCDVRAAAMNACQGRDDLPKELLFSRTFEPPQIVYKKCIAGVIVCAVIPPDAHVRGGFGRKCRASKAKIAGVIGNVHGANVGISIYDQKTAYEIGDTVEIGNFDLSDEKCSTGFHFFCTRAEAEAYS